MKASERAADLTRQLLAYAGKGRHVLTSIDLSAAVEEIASLVRSSIPSNVRLEFDLNPALPAIEADPAQIQQIVMNLLINAAEAVPEDRHGIVGIRTAEIYAGDEDLRSTLFTVRPDPGRFVLLQVSDNGCGMDASTQSRIFEPFFTTKFTGRGLGLSAVMGIVGSYKGAIGLDSKPGSGTVFRVYLPASQTAVETAQELPLPSLDGHGEVLVIDDEPLVLSFARNVLQRRGYLPLLASSGEEGVGVARQTPNLVAVLLDLTMPGMNGRETCAELQRTHPDVPIILSSGHSESDAAREFNGTPLAGYLQKPYTANQLAEKLKLALIRQSPSSN